MTSLSEFCGDLRIPSSVEGEPPFAFVFAPDAVMRPPETLSCDSLVVKRGSHGYGNAKFDVVHIQAPRQTYRQLGILLVATVFHRGRVELKFAHEHTDLKSLVLEEAWIMSRPSHYELAPSRFTYWPEERRRHPWTTEDPDDMPKINFDDDPNGLSEATSIVDSSCDRGRILLGGLFLDVGRNAAQGDEYHLESECGYRGVGPGGAELSIWLPDSIGWDPELWGDE